MSINRTIKALLIFIFTLNLSDALFSPLFAVFVKGSINGATYATVGISVAIFSVVKSIVQVPLAKFLDRKTKSYLECYAMICGAVLSAFYAIALIATSSVSILYILSAVNGIAAAMLMAAFYGMFSHSIDNKYMSYEWSLLSVGGQTMSMAIGAFIGGILVDKFGFKDVLYIVATLNFVAVGIFSLLLPFHRRSIRRSAS